MKRVNKENDKQTSSSENDSSSSEDDENAELLTEELEEGFFKVLSQLKKKDSKLYEESVKYFPSEKDGSLDSTLEKNNKRSQEEYREWLKGQKKKVENEEVKKDLKALHDFWTCPTLNKDEQFLRDYILNKKFLEPDQSFNIEEEINKLSDEEREVEEELLFEHEYNRRFETSEEDPVVKNRSKSKRKNNKGNEEVLIHTNNSICTYNDISASSEKVESSVVETNIVTKKKKKKRNRHLENKKTEEAEEITKVENENIIKREEEQGTLPEHVIAGNHEDVSQENRIGKCKRRKSRKRKRNNSVQNNEENPTLNISSNVNTSHLDIVPPKKKSKKKRNLQNIEVSGTNNMQENVLTLSQEKKNQPNNIPRNLLMKNKKGVKKLRHRNIKKGLCIQINSKDIQETGVGQEKYTVGFNKSSFGKKAIYPNELNNRSVKKINNFHPKKIKHFQNLIVKEKKNKELKFGKILSKKQKAAKAVGKS